MSDSYMVITEKDWEQADERMRSWMLFNTIQNMNCRLKELEKRPSVEKIYAFAGGVIGGAAAYIGLKAS